MYAAILDFHEQLIDHKHRDASTTYKCSSKSVGLAQAKVSHTQACAIAAQDTHLCAGHKTDKPVCSDKACLQKMGKMPAEMNTLSSCIFKFICF